MQPTPPWIKSALLIVLVVGVLWLLVVVSNIVMIVIVAALLAYLFDPVVKDLEARGLSRTPAATLVFIVLVLLVTTLFALLAPLVAAQFRALNEGIDIEQLRAVLERVEQALEGRMAFLGIRDLNLLERTQTYFSEHAGDLLNFVPGALSTIGQLALIPFLLFFLLRDSRRIKKGFISLVPNRYFEFALILLHKIDRQLGNYLRGQGLAALTVGILSAFALWLLDVDYFIIIGLFAGLTNLIPYLGPVSGAIVAVLVSIVTTGSFDKVIPIIIAFALVQLIDNIFVQPLVLARNVSLHPVTVLLALLVGGQLFGFPGLLIAVPTVAVVKVASKETVIMLRAYRTAHDM